jgi:hypothetical protein
MTGGQSFRLLALLLLALIFANCGKRDPQPGTVQDEALAAGRNADSFPAADEDYFKDMDGGVTLTANEVKGRNNWIVWTGGNDRFWDHLFGESFGAVDFLKILSSHPGDKTKHLSRNTRWKYLGLVNEPCFEKPSAPRSDRFGLWLDTRSKDCPPDPFENETKYPGVKSARGVRTISRWGRFTAMLRESSACACSPIPPLMKPPRRNGTRKDFIPIRIITAIRI